LLLGYLCQVRAATPVSGTILDDHWTEASSPYLVTGDILVARLTIDAAVQVLVQGDYVIEVAGILTVNGTSDSKVIFTRTNGTWRGIYFNNSDPSSVLRYAVVSHANSSAINIANSLPRLQNCEITGNTKTGGGAGILATITTGELLLEGCTVANNFSTGNGAGVFANVGSGILRMTYCTISNNISDPSGAGNPLGGGVYVNGNSVLKRCVIAGNTCSSWQTGTASYARGGGIYYASGSSLLENCWITNNYANAVFHWSGVAGSPHGDGGGIYLKGGVLATRNTIVAFNRVRASGGGGSGNFVDGSGLYVYSGTAGFTNCTFAYNSGAEAVRREGGIANVMNSILYFNNGGGTQTAGTVTIAYSDVQNYASGTNNIDRHPIFQSETELMIVPGSPCIDAGNPDPAHYDVCFFGNFSLGTMTNDMGAHGGPGACGWSCPCISFPSQPRSLVKCVGQDAEFSVVVDSSGPATYQWYFNTNTPIPDATNSTLLLSSVQLANAGTYHVVVSNPFCTSSSIFASLRITRVHSSIDLYPGIWFTNLVIGQIYEVQSTSDIAQTSDWLPLGTFIASDPAQLWFDREPARWPTRFYKLLAKP
jgi:hypothetical protein